MRSLRLLIASFTIFLAPLPAWALDIGSVEMLWLQDSVDGTPIVNPFELEIVVNMNDSAGLAAVELVSPGSAGTVSLSLSAGEWSINPRAGFASNTDLFTSFPSGASYTLNFLDGPSTGGGTVIDFFTITLSPIEVTDMLAITSPIHQSVVPVGQSVNWTNCSACDGSSISGFLVDLGTDTDTDMFFTSDLNTVSWSPTGMLPATNYEFEMILASYTHLLTTESSNLGDSFSFVSGFENLNLVTVTTVPEPGTASLLTLGLVGFGLSRRLSARRRPAG